MSKIKKYVFVSVYFCLSAAGMYNFVWQADWTLKHWPEGEVRRWYIKANAQNLLNPINPDAGIREQIAVIEQARPGIENDIANRLLLSFGGAGAITLGLVFLPGLRRRRDDKEVRGAALVDAATLKKLTRKLAGANPRHIAGIPLPVDCHYTHFLIEGTTGTGKSREFFKMIGEARALNHRGLVFDVGGAYVSRFYRPGDVILSIGDSRSVGWNPFREIKTQLDFAEMARAVVPDGQGENAGWQAKAQVLFAAVMQSLYNSGEHSVKRLVYLVGTAEAAELTQYVTGTPAAIFAQEGNGTMLANVRGIIATYLMPWSILPDGGEFSIKEWVQNAPAGQFLFITYRDNQLATLRQLLAAWMQLAINETLSLDEETCQPSGLFCDEFDTLGKISATKEALTKLRKYKTYCTFGIQAISQLRSTYGRDDAQTMLSCLSTKLYLRAGDPDTAKYCADDLGQHQILRTEESENSKKGLSVGDKSATQASRHVTEHVVMAAELQKLPNLAGYLCLAGAYPVARVTVTYSDPPRVCKPFA